MILEKIDADADAQAIARIVEILRREVEIDLRLDGHRTSQEEGIADMGTRQHVVIVIAMTELQSCTQEDAILLDVVTAGSTNSKHIGSMLPMVIAHLGECQQVILHHEATTGIKSQMEFLGLTADVETRHRGAQVDFSLFKLCVRGY